MRVPESFPIGGNRFLNIDSKAWLALEETAASSEVTHHIGAVQLFSCTPSITLFVHLGCQSAVVIVIEEPVC